MTPLRRRLLLYVIPPLVVWGTLIALFVIGLYRGQR